MQLNNNDRRMLKAMLSDPGRTWSLEQLLSETGWQDQVHIAGSGKSLESEGLVELEETRTRTVILGPEGSRAVEDGLLESRIWDWVMSQEDSGRTIKELNSAGFKKSETGPGIGLLKGLGVDIDSGKLVFSDERGISDEISRRSDFLSSLSSQPADVSSLDENMVKHFSSRRGLLEFEDSVTRTWRLTKEASSIDDSSLSEIQMIGEITPEMLQTESWKDGQFKPFDVLSLIHI